MADEREHVLSTDCWCKPIRLAYGDKPVYDDDGNLLDMVPMATLDAEGEDDGAH